jgi:hypothetical protein
MLIERRTPRNTAVVLVDPLTSFATLFRSQSIEENVNATVALAKTARGYGVPLVVTAPPKSPRAGGAARSRDGRAVGEVCRLRAQQ